MLTFLLGRLLLACLLAGVPGGILALVLTGVSLQASHLSLNRLDERRRRRRQLVTPYTVPNDNWSKQ